MTPIEGWSVHVRNHRHTGRVERRTRAGTQAARQSGRRLDRLHGGRRRRPTGCHRRCRAARHRRGQRCRLPRHVRGLHGHPAVLRGRIHRVDTVCRGRGRVLLLRPDIAGLSGRYRYRVRRARQLCRDRGRCLRPARPGGWGDRRTVRRSGPAVVGIRGGGVRGHDVRRLPQHRAVQQGAGGAADRRDRDRGRAGRSHRLPGR